MLQNIILHNSFRPDILPVAWATEGSSIMLISLAKPSSTSIVCKCGLGLAQMFKKPEAKKKCFLHSFAFVSMFLGKDEKGNANPSQSFQLCTLHQMKKREKITWTRD